MSLSIDLEWPENRTGKAEDVARVRISASGHVLTQILDFASGSIRDHFRASSTALAFWFGDNWWRLRCEPLGEPHVMPPDWRLRHELSSGSSNELWPAIMIYGGGPRVIVAPALRGWPEAASIGYAAFKPASLAGSDYEDGIDHFFARVVTDCAAHADAGALTSLIRQLSTERADPELSAWRRLEACLGYDPDKAPDAVIDAIVAREERLGAEAIEEAAAAAPGTRAPEMLTAVIEAAEASTLTVDFAVTQILDDYPDPHGATPWRAAENAAELLRERLQLPDVIDGQTLGDLLKTRWTELKEATATARNLPYAAKLKDDSAKAHLALQMNPIVDRRFELARMIGDEIWTRGRGFGVVSRARTDRQKFQRAFAQSLLCPMHSLRRWIDLDRPTDRQIEQAARHHQVRDKVVETILLNRNYLQRDSLAASQDAA